MTQDEIIAEITRLLGLPAEQVLPKMDDLATANPQYSSHINAIRNFIAECYAALAGNTSAGLAQAFAIIKSGSGPVDPDVGDSF